MPLPRTEQAVSTSLSDKRVLLESFSRDVGLGLGDMRKHLPCRYFYDYEGSLLFEDICGLPEYYQTRTEKKILESSAAEIIGGMPEDVVLVELGSGSSVKTTIIIEALLTKHGRASYTPIDISRSMLEESAAQLRNAYDGLEVVSIAAEYREGLKQLRNFDKRPELILWLGSSIGNFERDAAVAFLKDITTGLSPHDRLLVGFDLVKDVDILKSAYNDSQGVTAAFNLNLLARINRELGGNFDLDSFKHIAEYNTELNRIEMYIVSNRDQDVRTEAMDRTFHFDEGERIHTENSHKYTHEAIEKIAGEAGLHIIRQWQDPRDLFNLTLFMPANR